MVKIEDRWLNFGVDEYKIRLENVKKSMAEKGMDVLLLEDPANLCYLTGFDGWSFYVPQSVIVFIDQEQPMWIGRAMDKNAAYLTTWLDDENIDSYTEDHVQSDVKHPMEHMARVIEARGYGNKTIGTEMDAYFFSAKCQSVLEAGLPNAKFVDATNLVNWVRIIKSPKEIEYMRIAGQILEKGVEAVEKYVSIGNRQCDAAGEVYNALTRGTETHGGEYAAFIPVMPAGVRTTTPHLTWTDEKYKDGEMVIIEIAGVYKRYHCPSCRTVALGNVNPKVADVEKAVVEGMSAALDAVKPGMTGEEVEKIWQDSIAKHGFFKESRLAYSTGLNYPPDWGEHTISFRAGEKGILQPNMTFHMVPSLWFEDFGIEISEAFVVTEKGAEPLNNLPRSLIVKK